MAALQAAALRDGLATAASPDLARRYFRAAAKARQHRLAADHRRRPGHEVPTVAGLAAPWAPVRIINAYGGWCGLGGRTLIPRSPCNSCA